MPELQDLIRLFLRDWDVRFGQKLTFYAVLLAIEITS
jgi:hypothetical protein